MSKTGFSTLNRWLGRKNKSEKSLANGKLSKSNLNLSISSTNLNDSTTTLDYNRITPLPIVTSNAPFEQTFRITVLLPKDQLYVARLGARVPLSKLLELICDNKQLDHNKYEFRNPVDPSQVYNCDLTIGAVGLSEIRLCHRGESYDSNFNIRDSLSSSELSHSRFSKHTNKTTSPYSSTNSLNSMDSSGLQYTRTPLLITASNNPPNSQHFMRPPSLPPVSGPMKVMVAPPPRKKRAAPRPPSQISIPEKSVLVVNNNTNGGGLHSETNSLGLRQRTEDRCVSTPNLATLSNVTPPSPSLNGCQQQIISCDDDGGHSRMDGYHHPRMTCNNASSSAINVMNGGYAVDTVVYAQVQKKNAQNLYKEKEKDHDVEVERDINGSSSSVPEPPTPRKRNILMKKKSAPAPPPRHSLCFSDNGEDVLSTETFSSSECSGTLLYNGGGGGDYATVQELQQQLQQLQPPSSEEKQKKMNHPHHYHISDEMNPKPIPRMNGMEEVETQPPLETLDLEMEKYTQNGHGPMMNNVSKTMLNCSPTIVVQSSLDEEVVVVEMNDDDDDDVLPPVSSSSASPDSDSCYESHLERLKTLNGGGGMDDDNASKQADSGIGEPGGLSSSPLPDSLPVSEMSANDCKSNFESSSDDDDLIKVYNFKLGKTMVKGEEEVVDTITPKEGETTTTKVTPTQTTITTINGKETAADSIQSSSNMEEMKNWNVVVPISPPPTFADAGDKSTTSTTTTTTIMKTTITNINDKRESTPDTPITPKITERPILDFAALQKEEDQQNRQNHQLHHPNHHHHQKMEDDRGVGTTTTTPMSPTTPLNGLVEELSLIINGKGVDSLIRKPRERPNGIEAATENTLQNFSITTIGGELTTINRSNGANIVDEQKNDENDDGKGMKEEDEVVESIHLPIIIHNGKEMQRIRSVNRTDSFHSTLMVNNDNDQDDHDDDLKKNDDDFMMTEKEDRRHHLANHGGGSNGGSSELSIGESPSLQSLEVIKTILQNNRHNCLEAAKVQKRGEDGRGRGQGGDKESIESIESRKEKILPQQQQQDDDDMLVVKAHHPSSELQFTSLELKPKRQPPVTAPKPSANKMNNVIVPENKVYRYSGPPSINVSTWNERPKMQVAIKNEGDYIFGGKGANKNTNNTNNITSGASSSGAITSMASISRNGNNQLHSLPEHKSLNDRRRQKGMSLDIVSRMGIPEGEFKVPPIMVKPLQDVVVESTPKNEKEKEEEKRVEMASTLPRSMKKWRPENGGCSSSSSSTLQRPNSSEKMAPPLAPFGQNTLRRTGLKEKILAGEGNVAAGGGSLEVERKTVEELVTRTSANHLLNGSSSKRPLERSSSLMPPPPPPPPTQPPITNRSSIVLPALKKVMVVKSAPVTPSSPEGGRDQLLEAIRSFDRSQLKRK